MGESGSTAAGRGPVVPGLVAPGLVAPGLVAQGLVVQGLVVQGLQYRGYPGSVDLVLFPGQLGLVQGSSAAAVSAWLSTCAGHRARTHGEITVNGTPVHRDPPSTLIGYAGRFETLIGSLTAVENLLLTDLAAGRTSGALRAGRVAAAEQQLARLDLGPAVWHNLVEQLSGGQRQRVAVARALLRGPGLLVLDHPTSELDPGTTQRVADLVTEVRAAGTCVLLASDEPLLTAGPDVVITV